MFITDWTLSKSTIKNNEGDFEKFLFAFFKMIFFGVSKITFLWVFSLLPNHYF